MKLESLVDDRRLDQLTERVAALEQRTSAEVVVVLRPQSGSYRDVALGASLVISLIALGVLVYAPFEIHYDALVPAVLLITGVAFGTISAWSQALRTLAGAPRLTDQAREAAAAAFARHEVWGTRARSGLLVYYSHLERRLELIPDLGIKAVVPTGALNEVAHTFHQELASLHVADALSKALDRLAPVLERAYPKAADDTNERADRPILEP